MSPPIVYRPVPCHQNKTCSPVPSRQPKAFPPSRPIIIPRKTRGSTLPCRPSGRREAFSARRRARLPYAVQCGAFGTHRHHAYPGNLTLLLLLLVSADVSCLYQTVSHAPSLPCGNDSTTDGACVCARVPCFLSSLEVGLKAMPLKERCETLDAAQGTGRPYIYNTSSTLQ